MRGAVCGGSRANRGVATLQLAAGRHRASPHSAGWPPPAWRISSDPFVASLGLPFRLLPPDTLSLASCLLFELHAIVLLLLLSASSLHPIHPLLLSLSPFAASLLPLLAAAAAAAALCCILLSSQYTSLAFLFHLQSPLPTRPACATPPSRTYPNVRIEPGATSQVSLSPRVHVSTKSSADSPSAERTRSTLITPSVLAEYLIPHKTTPRRHSFARSSPAARSTPPNIAHLEIHISRRTSSQQQSEEPVSTTDQQNLHPL